MRTVDQLLNTSSVLTVWRAPLQLFSAIACFLSFDRSAGIKSLARLAFICYYNFCYRSFNRLTGILKKNTIMSYKMERFKVTLSDDSNLKKQYGSTTGSAQVETSIARGNLELDFNESLGRTFQAAYF